MNRDFAEMLAALSAAGAEFLVVGVFPTADPDTPLVVRIPIGTYEVTLANATRVVTIERDRTSKVTFD